MTLFNRPEEKVYLDRNGSSVKGSRVVNAYKTGLGGRNMQSQEPLVASNGDLNAHDKGEALAMIGNLIEQYKQGNMRTATAHDIDPVQARQAKAEEQAMIEAAFADPNGMEFLRLGQATGDVIWETMGREGFLRRIFLTKTLGRGEIGRFRVRRKDVLAHLVSSDANTIESVIRQNWVYPQEYYVNANVQIEDREIEQCDGDILDEKYTDGLEAMLVQEDRLARRLLNTGSTAYNTITYFTTLTPAIFSSLRTQVGSWGIPVSTCLLSWDLWDDIISDTDFVGWFDEIHKHELILEGRLGSMLDVDIITDYVRYETLKVMEEGEIFMLTAPQNLGGVTQRKPTTAAPINLYPLGKPVRGWFMEQIQGTALVNPRGVAKGQRL